MKNKILLMILLIPLSAGAQLRNAGNVNEWLRSYIQNNNRSHFNENKESGLRGDTSFLSATRTDTFDIVNSTFNEVDSSQYLYNLDSTLNALVQLVNDPDTGWINYLANYYEYDSQQNDTVDFLSNWDYIQGIWSNEARTVKTYDVNNNLLSSTSYSWDTITPWKPYFREEYTYDSSSNVVQLVYFSTLDGTTWDSTAKFVYTYDSSNNRITETDYSFSGNTILPQNLSTATFNSENYEVQNIIQRWDGQWKNQYKDTLSYDANNNLTVFERREWHSGSYSWTYAKTEFTYNAMNQVISRTDYDGDQVTYLLTYQNTYQYNADGYLSYNLQQRYNATIAAFENAQQTFYYYTSIISGISSIGNKGAMDISLYPNPASQEIQIALKGDHASQIHLQLMDMTGRIYYNQKVTIQPGSQVLDMSLAGFPSGVYTVIIFDATNSYRSSGSFIKE